MTLALAVFAFVLFVAVTTWLAAYKHPLPLTRQQALIVRITASTRDFERAMQGAATASRRAAESMQRFRDAYEKQGAL